MNRAQFEDKTLETAWQEVEYTFRSAGMVSPRPGFTQRWHQKLAAEKAKQERKQAWLLVISNLVIALGFFGLIGLQMIPSIAFTDNILTLWVDLISRLVVSLKMFFGIAGTLGRTLPGVIPTSWWVSGFTLAGMLVVLWVSMVRRFLHNQTEEQVHTLQTN